MTIIATLMNLRKVNGNWRKWEQGCVVDNVFYYYDVYKNKLRAHDPN